VAIETQKLMQQLNGKFDGTVAAQRRIAVVIPCYRERAHILDVLDRIPPEVTRIVCVDDGCPDKTGALIEEKSEDPRVTVVVNEHNEGVGGATKRGYRTALEAGADIVVKLDGDGQMDPALIPELIAPIADGHADYTKGNRFFSVENTTSMPRYRIIGNIILSFVNKFSSGYWHVFDPNNGFTAIHSSVLRLVPMSKVSGDYFFESDLLFRLNTLRAVVVDVPMLAIYGNEESHLKVRKALPIFAAKHAGNFFKRIFYSYFLRDFSVASIQWILGPLLFVFGTCFGLYNWIAAGVASTAATAGTVMLAALPIIIGLQFILAAIDFDVRSVPSIPLQRLLSKGLFASDRIS
jgi:dolichol-phosphate mannosyltransferase